MCWMASWLDTGEISLTVHLPLRSLVSHHSPVTRLGDPGSNQSQHTGQSPPHQEISKKSFNCTNNIGKNCHRSERACHKYLLPRVWRKVCWVTQTSSRSPAWSLRHKSQVRFVTSVQSTDRPDCWHPPPTSDQGVGAACVCYKDQQMVSAGPGDRSDSWGVDQTFQLWLAASWWIFDICGHL